MTVTSVYAAANVATTSKTTSSKGGMGSMGSADFLKLMLAQMQQQDPTNPMDNKDMLAQMAQFSALSNQTEMTSTLKQMDSSSQANLVQLNATLKLIAEKLGVEFDASGNVVENTNPTAASTGSNSQVAA